MDFYTEIKNQLIDNEVIKKAKDYSKNKSELETYYNVGKELSQAGKKYGESIIKKYSEKLMIEVGKKYNERTLRRYRQFYEFQKWSTLSTKLSWSHYVELLSLKDINEINYYIDCAIKDNLGVRDLRLKIKNNEYQRIDNKAKIKIKERNSAKEISDYIKHPIIIKTDNIKEKISEKLLKKLILEDIDNFLKELGSGFCYIESEYKLKFNNINNYIDLLLFNINFNCYVVIELKITELKKEHIGQIKIYMNYIDKHLKNITQDKTIGIIICKKETGYVIEYVSDPRIYATSYILN